jgi:hypothetical protein
MKTLEDRWESSVSRLGAESFPDFLRSHWNSRKAFARQSDLFKTIRGKVADRAAVFAFTDEEAEAMGASISCLD